MRPAPTSFATLEGVYGELATYWFLKTKADGSRDPDVPWIRQRLKKWLEPGSSVLEVGCGHGRVLVPLAQDGWNLTGLDSSAAMIESAREFAKATKLLSKIHTFHTDFLTYQSKLPHDALVAAMGTLQLMSFSDEEFFSWAKSVLKPRALFLFDLDVSFQGPTDSSWHEGPQMDWIQPGYFVKIRGRCFRNLKSLSERFELVYDLYSGNKLQKSETQEYTIQYYTGEQILQKTEKMGFEVGRVWSDYKVSGFKPEADRWAVECFRKA